MKIDELVEKYNKKFEMKKKYASKWDLYYPGHSDYFLCKEIVEDLKSLEYDK